MDSAARHQLEADSDNDKEPAAGASNTVSPSGSPPSQSNEPELGSSNHKEAHSCGSPGPNLGGHHLDGSSENDKEASSCDSPPQAHNSGQCPLEGLSENDMGKDLNDGCGDDMMDEQDHRGQQQQQQQHHHHHQHQSTTSGDLNNKFPTTTLNASTTSVSMPTFHGSRNSSHIGRKPAFGQTCSMKTLLQDGILQTGEKVLTLEYEGSKFFGDLQKDGTIMMRGPDEGPHIYATPVAWANHCCKMLNPESKPLNAWSSIRFKGKRLDSYKLKWYRAQKAQKKPATNNNNINNNIHMAGNSIANANQQGSSRLMIHNPIRNYFENPIKNKKLIKSLLINNNMDNECKKLVAKSIEDSDVTQCKTSVINYEQLGTRGPHNTHNPNTMVKCIPFSAVDRIQPFNVTVSTNALLLVEFHSHLVNGEVAGYLAGSWDANQHILTVTQAFPCRAILNDESTASTVEEEIRQDIEKRNLTVVGWYHSHQGQYSNHPTIKDIQNQLEYQITMKESSSGYIPCIGLICSPHDIRSEDDLSPSFQIYWVMPPPEHLVYHYGRPMQMYYSVTRDLFLTQDLLLEMRLLANFHQESMVNFDEPYEYNTKYTNLEKLSESIKPKLPRDLQESEYPDEPAIWKAAVDHFWKFLKNLVVDEGEAEEQ